MEQTKGISKGASLGICVILILFMEIGTGFSEIWYTGILRFFVSAIFVYCIYKGLQQEYIINAYLLFSLTPLSLLIYSEDFSSYYLRELTASTWVFAIINMVAFLAAYSLSGKRPPKKVRMGPLNFYDVSDENTEIDQGRLKQHAVILSIIGFLPSVYSLAFKSTMPLSAIIGFFAYIGIAFAFRSRNRGTILICVLMSAFGFFQDFNKTRLLYLVLTILLCIEVYVVESKRQRSKYMGVGLLAAIGMLLIAFPLKSFTRSGGDILSFFKNGAEISANAFSYYDNRFNFSGPNFLRMPYMYLAQGWNNLQHVMQTQDTRTFGLWLFKPLLGYLQIDGSFAEQYVMTPFSPAFNTFTYMAVLFKDFGYYGSVFGSIILGVFVKAVVRRLHKDCSAFATASSALVLMATLEMFFSNHFFGMSYPFTIVIIGFLYMKLFHLDGY